MMKHKQALIYFMFGCLFLLQACNFNMNPENVVPQEKLNKAKQKINLILQNDYDALVSASHPNFKKNFKSNQLAQIYNRLPDAQPVSINLVDYATTTLKPFDSGSSVRTIENFTFQYQYPERWVLVDLQTEQTGNNDAEIIGFNFRPLKNDLSKINSFNLFDLDTKVISFVMLLVSVGVFLFIIMSLFMCYKTPVPKRKWLWYIFIAVGFCSFHTNWTTGAVTFNPLMIQLLGSGFFRTSMYAPVILQTSIPIGAIIFQFKRKKWLVQKTTVEKAEE